MHWPAANGWNAAERADAFEMYLRTPWQLWRADLLEGEAGSAWEVVGRGRVWQEDGQCWLFPRSLLRVPDSACTCSLTTFIQGIALACLLALAWCLAYDEHPVNIYQVISYHLPCVYYENITNQNNTTVQFYVCSISHQYIYFMEELVYLLRTLQGLCSGLKLVCMKTCVYSM